MRYASHYRAINAPPCYQASATTLSRETDALTAPAFPDAFHGTRNGRKPASDALPTRPRESAQPPSSNAWPVALAVMLVANLITPAARATPMLPRLSGRSHEGDDSPGSVAAPPSDGQAEEYQSVERRPLTQTRIKSQYTAVEFLRAVASASAPFLHIGKAMGDAYAAVSGNEVGQEAIQRAQRVGGVVDAATGLIPKVQMIRLPGRLADVLADDLEGKPLQPEKITDILQFGDPRALGSDVPLRHESAPVQPVPAREAPMPEPAPAPEIEADVPVEPAVDRVSAENAFEAAARSGNAAASPEVGAGGASFHPSLHVEGEREYLQGYEQSLSPEQIPPGPHRQLFIVNGRHYLGGESGYYHVTPGLQAHHWLINAPRGERAQVPVTFDPQTGAWRADAPLRLCGGGCGPSRESTPDSVAMSKNDVEAAIRHIPDRDVREAIQQAYSDLAHLHLKRTNREDLRPMRDNSIVEHRRILVPQLMRLDPGSSLFELQREAAMVTTIHYDNYVENSLLDLTPEAFCQENSEILFHYLLARGVLSHHIRMITIRPQGRPPHVMVLYTESDPFIDVLDLSTPQPPVSGHEDGIPGETFIGALFLTRDSTVLLDPWSRIKATSFPWVNDVAEVQSMLDIALADTGHRSGSPFTVSLTRPYPAPRERVASAMGSSVSMKSGGSSGGSSGESVQSGPVRRDPPIRVPGGGQGTSV